MSEGIVFAASCGRRLKVDSAVLDRLKVYRQLAPHQCEAGGVLLGRHLLGTADIVVDDLTEPMPGDTRSRLRFSRQQRSHQRRIDAAWLLSQGTCIYLGEWHTHPELDPTPSSTDLADWRRHLRADVYDGDSLYFVIVGIGFIRAWEGERTGRISPLDRFGQVTSESVELKEQ